NGEEVSRVFDIMSARSEPLFLMGDGSNLLFDSAGFDGVILRIGRRMAGLKISGRRVRAEAGIWVPQLARHVGRAGLSGIEHTIGIPGTLGGLILMNGGSKRKGVGSNIVRVNCVANDGVAFSLDHANCGFAYRH